MTTTKRYTPVRYFRKGDAFTLSMVDWKIAEYLADGYTEITGEEYLALVAGMEVTA